MYCKLRKTKPFFSYFITSMLYCTQVIHNGKPKKFRLLLYIYIYCLFIAQTPEMSMMLRLYKAFVLQHLQYCSLMWHFCGTRNCDRFESLNKRILRYIFNDTMSSHDVLLKKAKHLYTMEDFTNW